MLYAHPVSDFLSRMHHVVTGFLFLNRSLVEEFRKTLCSLWQGSQTAFSPDSLFYAIWKIMPSFRYATVVQGVFVEGPLAEKRFQSLCLKATL